jgi:diguanylate cyclase (GGDEF)-like protein
MDSTKDIKKLEKEIKALKEKNIRLAKLVFKDPLTPAYNRRLFDLDINDHKAEFSRSSRRFSLLMLDLDNFKIYNDTYGHPQGDILLIDIVKAVRKIVRPYDRVYRIGGDEFAVIFRNIDEINPEELTERILEKMRELGISMSMSYGVFDEDIDIKTFMDSIDKQLYRVKEEGKDKAYFVNK